MEEECELFQLGCGFCAQQSILLRGMCTRSLMKNAMRSHKILKLVRQIFLALSLRKVGVGTPN